MNFKTLVCAASVALLANEAWAQANHNTTRSNRKGGAVAAPADTAGDQTATTAMRPGDGVDIRVQRPRPAVDHTDDWVAARVAASGDTGERNPMIQKALDGSGGAIVGSCTVTALPQGFTLAVLNREYGANGGDRHDIIVNKEVPWIFATSAMGVGIGEPGSASDPGPLVPMADYLGMQSSTNGLHPAGGWARTTAGQIITGKVYHIRGHSDGTPYAGGYVSHEFTGHFNGLKPSGGTCSQSVANHAIQTLNTATGSNVPSVNGASVAYNDASASVGNGGAGHGSGTNWAGELYDAYYADNGYPGWQLVSGASGSGGTDVTNTATGAPVDDLDTPVDVNHNTVRRPQKRAPSDY